MAARSFLGDEAFRGVLRAQVTHFRFDERVAFLEPLDEIAGDLTAPRMDEIQLTFLARILFQPFAALGIRQLGKLLIDLLGGSLSGKGAVSRSHRNQTEK